MLLSVGDGQIVRDGEHGAGSWDRFGHRVVQHFLEFADHSFAGVDDLRHKPSVLIQSQDLIGRALFAETADLPNKLARIGKIGSLRVLETPTFHCDLLLLARPGEAYLTSPCSYRRLLHYGSIDVTAPRRLR